VGLTRRLSRHLMVASYVAIGVIVTIRAVGRQLTGSPLAICSSADQDRFYPGQPKQELDG
jgi:hypothetical protein